MTKESWKIRNILYVLEYFLVSVLEYVGKKEKY